MGRLRSQQLDTSDSVLLTYAIAVGEVISVGIKKSLGEGFAVSVRTVAAPKVEVEETVGSTNITNAANSTTSKPTNMEMNDAGRTNAFSLIPVVMIFCLPIF